MLRYIEAPAVTIRSGQASLECAVIGCSNDATSGRRLYPFPVDQREKVVWVCLLGRIRPDGRPWVPPKGSVVCSDHFMSGRRLMIADSSTYYPSLFPAILSRDCLPTADKLGKSPRPSGYFKHSVKDDFICKNVGQSAKTRVSRIVVVKNELPEDVVEVDYDDMEKLLDKHIGKPIIEQFSKIFSDLDATCESQRRELLEMQNSLRSARVDFEVSKKTLDARSAAILNGKELTHVGELPPIIHSSIPQPSKPPAQRSAQIVFNPKLPSIVMDHSFTKLIQLRPSQPVRILEGRKIERWSNALVLEADYSSDSVKVRLSPSQREKTVKLANVAYGTPPNSQVQIGTRVVSKYSVDGHHYAGVVVEYPKCQNKKRYLVVFEDGYVQYSEPSNIFMICKQTSAPWQHVYYMIHDFVRDYLRTSERALLRGSVGQTVKAEHESQWYEAKILATDGNIIQLGFLSAGQVFHSEWVYAGSTRFEDLFLHQQQQKKLEKTKSGSNQKIARRKQTHRKNQPYIEFVDDTMDVIELSDDEEKEDDQAHQKVRNTARKSTTQMPKTAEDQKKMRPKVVQGTVEKIVVEGIINKKLHETHNCTKNCISERDDDPLKHTDKSPYLMPYYVGWSRLIQKVKKRSIVYYKAPCGRQLRGFKELMDYLILTESKLNIDQFCFEPDLDIFAVWKDSQILDFKADITGGQEIYPISMVNPLESKSEPLVEYWPDRRPSDAVKKVLNLDPQFLPCCSCEDDCLDRSKCECQQLTVQVSDGAGGTRNEDAGYAFRSLDSAIVTGIFECNTNCSCSKRCINRVAQNGIQIRIQLFRTDKKGFGVRVLHDVPAGRFICNYSGVLLSEKEADGQSGQDQYLAELDHIEVCEQEKEGYESDVSEYIEDDFDDVVLEPGAVDKPSTSRASSARTTTSRATEDSKKSKEEPVGLRQKLYNEEDCYVMDSVTGGNIGRYFNHSCDPNLFVQNVFVDTHDLRFPWVGFFALRNIAAGEEITWDYSYQVDSVPGKKMYCYCGSKNCRGRLL